MSIQGQYIEFNINVAPAAGATVLQISDADEIAARMPYLAHAMSPKSLVPLSGGGVSGFCRVTGETLIQKVSSTLLKVSDVGGKKALGFNNIAAAGSLAWQPGSAAKSYSLVMLVNQPVPVDRCDYLTVATADAPTSTPLRYFPNGTDTTNKVISYGAGIAAPLSAIDKPNGTWFLAFVDYDDETHKTSLSLNQVDTFVESTRTTASPVTSNSYIQVGYAGSSSSLRNANIGDIYYFDNSLRRNSVGMTMLQQLVAALKTEYGIA